MNGPRDLEFLQHDLLPYLTEVLRNISRINNLFERVLDFLQTYDPALYRIASNNHGTMVHFYEVLLG